jgi:GT2 family glycosyltransferase
LFILTKDRLDYTVRTLDSLWANTTTGFDLYLVDNGSTDGSIGYFRDHADRFKEVILNPHNMGISIGHNQALDAIGAGYDYIVQMDNDCEVITYGWLEEMVRVIRALDDKAVLSPFVEGLRENRGGAPRHEERGVAGHIVGFSQHVGGISVVAPASVFSEFRYPVDEPLHGNQDVLFSRHVLARGLELGYVEDVRVRHMDGTDGQHERYPEYFRLAKRESRTLYGHSRVVSGLLLKLRGLRRRVRRLLSRDGRPGVGS